MRVDPNLHREVAGFGAKDLTVCMNCGNCTAVCPLSEGDHTFPRKTIQYLKLGLKDKLMTTLDPWLCYYCGECSTTCPREANPGETMMAARRFLTAAYDWTGISRLLYLSPFWETAAVGLVAAVVVALFYFLHGPMVLDHVELNTFAPVKWVELGDLVMAAVLSAFLLTNAFRMFLKVMSDIGPAKVPLSVYLSEIPTFVSHFFTQKRWRQCNENRITWLKHLLLVSGYLTMLTLVLIFLRWFQTDEIHPFYHPQRLLGYYATAMLLYVTADRMISRLKKEEEMHKFSEFSDWMFLVLLFLTALTGIMLHLFRITGMPLSTYYIYVIHLAVAVPMLVVEVPFGKWAHLLYRPLAMYLFGVRKRAESLAGEESGKDVRAEAA